MAKSSLENSFLAYVTALCIIAMSSLVFAGYSAGGGGAYLRMPVGAQALAQGGAVGAAPGYFCTWINPAIPATLRSRVINVGSGYYSYGRTEGHVSVDFKIPPRAGMGISFLYRGDPSIAGLKGLDEADGVINLKTASFSSITFKVGLSYIITRSIAAGFNIGIYYENLPTSYTDDGTLNYSSGSAIGGIDFGMRYAPSQTMTYGLVLRNLATTLNWKIDVPQYDLQSTRESNVDPLLIASGMIVTTCMQKPLRWYTDCSGSIFDKSIRVLEKPEAVLATGVEWQRWDNFFIRAGIGDVLLNRDMVFERDYYAQNFMLRVTAGFMYNAKKIWRGASVNYAVSTDKVWKGIDQQLDIVRNF